jgi:long-chain acyl-CoA synthetase
MTTQQGTDRLPATIAELALQGPPRFGPARAHRSKRDGSWRQRSYAELADAIREVGQGLVGLGVAAGDRVCVLAETRQEWVEIQLGAAAAGAVTVPIYASNTPDECAWVAGNSGAVAVICENAAQLAKIDQVRDQLPKLVHFVVIDADDLPAGTLSLAELRQAGRKRPGTELDERAAAVRPDDPSLTIYTSGTTGRPKGCVLTNGNLTAVCRSVATQGIVNGDDLMYLFLPLAHVFGQVIQLAAITVGAEIGYVSGGPKSIVPDCGELGPTVFPSAPRIFEKVYSGFAAKVPADQLAAAVEAGLAKRDLDRAGQPVPEALLAGFEQADAALFGKVRALLGGRIRVAISGSAPIAPAILEFFHAAGVPIYEGWGLTETAGIGTLATEDALKIGTIGRPVPEIEVRVAEDGELMVRGPMVFKEYWRNPAATAEAFTDGWFHTGDLGSVDEDGCLSITGRKKDIIITAGGKNLTPANIENDLRQHPLIAHAVMFGDRKPYPVALITLDVDEVVPWSARHGLPADLPTLAGNPQLRMEIQKALDNANGKYARVAQIKKFAVLDRELTVDAGEITPSMKVKRNVVGQNHADRIEALYREA